MYHMNTRTVLIDTCLKFSTLQQRASEAFGLQRPHVVADSILRRKRLLQSADNRFSTEWRHLRQCTSALLAGLDPWTHF